jgi:hypothetical protein
MTEISFAWCFSLCALAIWRIAHLLAKENGPWNLIVRLRDNLGSGMWGQLMDSFYCWSFLISLLPSSWLSSSQMGFLIQWMALSAVACLLERATQRQHMYMRITPISRSYLDKVIRGV